MTDDYNIMIQTEEFSNLISKVLSTLNVDKMLTDVVTGIRAYLGADRGTLFLYDKENNELYSKVLEGEELVEIRVPVNKKSLAGYTALTGKVLCIKDVYDDSELKSIDEEIHFDRKWDEKTGYRTKSILAIPVNLKSELVGVFQALNKPGGFNNDDIKKMQQLSFLLGIAINNALLHQKVNDLKILNDYIIENIDEGICILDKNKKIVLANRFLELMMGSVFSCEDIRGKNFFDIFPYLQNTELSNKIEETLETGITTLATLELMIIKIIPYLDEKGSIKNLVTIWYSSL